MRTEIKKGEHVLIAGITGCGKSVLVETFLASEESVIKLDTKNEVDERRRHNEAIWNGLEENLDYVIADGITEFFKYIKNGWRKIIYVPTIEEHQDPDKVYDKIFEYVYKAGDYNVWIDELMEVCPSPSKYTLYFQALYTRGRSKDVSVWSCTQRPTNIPTISIANSTHFFVFNLPLLVDRKKMAEMISEPKLLEQMKPYYFWYLKYGSNKRAAKGTLNLKKEEK